MQRAGEIGGFLPLILFLTLVFNGMVGLGVELGIFIIQRIN
jgi:hypothetical protein